MPWNTKSQQQMKKEFIQLVTRKEVSMSEACRLYEISRKTGYKWLHRYEKQGEKGLEEISRKPHNQTTKLNEDVICRIVEVRIAHRSWGADKIQAVLRREGKTPVPCRSTIHRILVKSSLVKRVRKRRMNQQNVRLSQEWEGAQKVNDEWSIDFKGWWWDRKHERKCYPLTIRDTKSRFILGVTLLSGCDEESVRRAMSEVFRKYGLPKVIRSDNGTPFASTHSLLGLSKLSVWWLRLGIKLNRSRVGCPQDNGAHERMHRDMKKELQAQKVDTQSEIDEWVRIFNFERPHQALQGDTPAEHYHKSSRKYKGSLVEIDYGKMATRIIDSHGDLKWHGVDYFLSEALRGERVGMAKIGEECYEVWFDVLLLGILDEGKRVFHPRREEKGKEGDLILGRARQRAKIREVD